MSELFDDVTRAVAVPISRRQALRLIGGTVGALFLSRFFQLPGRAMPSECDPAADPWYPHLCADVCCRYDYYCASTTLLNGADTYGICCNQSGTHLCSAGGYGWCCEDSEACGTERFTCVCAAGNEDCGNICCDTAAGEFCCTEDLCCSAGVVCCEGTCCPEEYDCVPISPSGYPLGRMCCPPDQACKGQCCPAGEVCIFQLACCPADRANSDRSGCCPSGFKYMASGGCCMDGLYCGGDICCTEPGEVCRDGRCQACPSGQATCFDTCCAPGTCCFGKCCGDGQTCTGECTTLETITETIDASAGGTLTSSDGGVTITFMGTGREEMVQYTSQAQPNHPLPEGDQLLRSFTLTTPTAGTRPQQDEQMVFYTMRVRYTEATLAAMDVESEYQLQLLRWDASSAAWAAVFSELDRPAEAVNLTQALLGEFALVAGEEVPDAPWMVYLPLVTR